MVRTSTPTMTPRTAMTEMSEMKLERGRDHR
jgi:hypothetical protein